MPTPKDLRYECKVCGSEFHPHYRGQQFCSFECGRHPMRGRSQSAEHVQKRIETTRRNLAETTRNCSECGEPFTPARAAQLYCTKWCYERVAQRRHRVRRSHKQAVGRAEYAQLVERYGNECGICGAKPDPAGSGRGRGRLPADHDHSTGKIRGLLCHACNTALGAFKDDPALLRAAIAYLETHKQE